MRQGRRFALATLSVGILLLAGTSLLIWDTIREEWYLHRLDSSDPQGRLAALDRLVELGCTREPSRLLEIVRKEAGVTELGSRAALALLALSPEASLRLYRENGRFWHLQLAVQCQDWVERFLVPKLSPPVWSKLYLSWMRDQYQQPDALRAVDFSAFQRFLPRGEALLSEPWNRAAASPLTPGPE